MKYRKRIIPFLALASLLFSGLSTASGMGKTEGELRKVRFGMGYIPTVQIAPIYVAQDKGFYKDQGLEVAVEYGFENDFVLLAAKGERECALASGDQVILARAKGVPITYVMKWHQRYPVAIVSPAAKNIKSMNDLTGKSLGIPMFSGASYIGWKALVLMSGIDEKKVNVKQIGFTQVAAIQQGLVDAAVVYIVNEPVQLRNAGIPITIINVSDQIDLVSNGLVVSENLIKSDPKFVEKLVKATLQGILYTIDHADEAFDISRKRIPEMTDKDAITQKQVLDESIILLKSEKPGVSTEKAWKDSVDFMLKTKLIDKPVEVNTLFTNQFIK